ncbi:Ribonuclease H-like protein [Dioscorea alata]|uniref:Ribonuclease H-like protein n=1 Tax=Dioscorea alata TaxID=55571 RepID=A0ACB7VUJ9_DIOAL|nr:Ribonuclease H-like protein [Dioscorea alata]
MAPVRSTGLTDPGWEHGVAQDEKKKKVKCNYCGKIVSGGIYRLKQHIARISGEVTYCKKAPEDVYLKMKENLEGNRAAKRQRQSEDEEHSFDLHSNDEYDEEEEHVGYRLKGKQVKGDQSIVVNMSPLRSLGTFVDPGWEHGVAQDEKKKKVKCNYCDKIVSGGINRFKQHLARIPGEVAYCKMAPEEVYLQMKENMKWHRTGRRRRPEAKDAAAFYAHLENDDHDELANGKTKVKCLVGDKDIPYRKGMRRRSRGRSCTVASTELQMRHINVDSVFPRIETGHIPLQCQQSKGKVAIDKKGRKEVIAAICKFFYHAAIPFDAANSPYFHKMLELVSLYGRGLKGPSSKQLSGRFLQDEVLNIKQNLVEIKASWTTTGCSIMADSWKDFHGRTLINFLVSCPRGTHFISSMDASDIVDDVTNLFNLLDKVVEDIGEENVVQVITENTPCYMAAGKMLEEKRRNLFWTPCAVSCIDQILEDLLKIRWVAECIDNSQKITKFIYNRAWLLNLMKREYTSGRDLLKPAIARYATSFSALENLLEQKAVLKRMFQSSQWSSSPSAKSDDGKEVEKIVWSPTFWKKMQFVKKSVQPVLHLLTKVENGEGLSMPCIYNEIYQTKLAIRNIHSDDERKYGPFWNVIQSYWKSLFQHPLYVAAYFLNPSFRYRSDFMADPEVIRGLNECITRLEPDNGRRVTAAAQISDFVFAKADFGTELALSTRTELDPAAWWQQHGINCLELRRIAIRILSQTCSSFGCAHNYSTLDHCYNTRRNRVAQKRLNDFAFVHYNLRLRERQLKRMVDDSISLDNVPFSDSFLDDWIVEPEKPAQQEDEDTLSYEMEHADTYINENESPVAESTKAHADSAALHEVSVPVEAHPVSIMAASDEDDGDHDFLDEDLSD